MNKWCLPSYNSLNKTLQGDYSLFIGSAGAAYFLVQIQNIIDCSAIFYISIASAILFIFFYNLMLRFASKLLAWISLLTVASGIVALGYLIWDYAVTYYPEKGFTYGILLATSVIIWVFVIFYLLFVLCMWHRLMFSIQILRTAAKIIHKNYHLMLVPICGVAFSAACFAGYIYFLIILATCGKISQGSYLGLTFSVYTFADIQLPSFVLSLCFFFWLLALNISICEYIVIVAVTQWYFNSSDDKGLQKKLKVRTGVWWTMRYNLGSLIFGSLILSVVWIFRSMFNAI